MTDLRSEHVGQVAGLTRRDGAIQEIRRAIVRGGLLPGEKITEVGLATRLGVSRPTLREALNQLSREGLLVQEPFRGMHVAELTDGEYLDIARIRHSLDLLAVEAFVDANRSPRMAQLDAHWDRFRAIELDPDPLVRHEAHVAFHRGIWEASENRVLLRLWPVIEAHITVALAQDQAIRTSLGREIQQHRELVAAIRSGDRSAIHKAFWRHTIGNAQELVTIIENQNRGAASN
ncbi:GntR family transcriptional regulator [Arthrobacter sp. NPDC058097]|uniref:GntR family transcriptional regulator n=1 Tax=Arthrobacter sp. NPDC058097 TaxID=3346340 RepID=UPI0036D760CB